MLKLGQNLIVALLLLLLVSKPTMALDDKDYNNNLQIINGTNQKIITTFKVRIAKNNSDQEKGLMFVKSLPESFGLLFDFPKEKIVNMWMKNTLISLDIIFIDKNDRVVQIFNSAPLLSQEIISSMLPAKKVLEINAGLAKKFDIKIGDKIKLVTS